MVFSSIKYENEIAFYNIIHTQGLLSNNCSFNFTQGNL